MTEYLVTETLPNDGQKVLCYGNLTYCCTEDMEEEKKWHEAIFRLNISSYKLKKNIPEDPEESILQEYEIYESWDCREVIDDGHVIGVTKWKQYRDEND